MLSRKTCAINILSKFVRNKSIALVGMSDMEGVFVRCVPEEERMQITVNYKHEGGPCKTVNLERIQVEEVGKTIERLKASMLKKLSKKKKRKKQETTDSIEEPDLKIWLTVKEKLIENEATPINQTFVEGAVLHIEDQLLPVEINVPVITALVLPTNIMVGFPIYPKIHAEFCDLLKSTFIWYRYKSVEDDSQKKKKTKEVWDKLSEGFSYTPSISDLGNKLKLTCMPKLGHRSGEEFNSLSKCDVEAGPGVCPFENRHLYTQNTLEDDGIRVVSYNILADIYADSDFSRNELFPYCPPYALAIDYRKQLFIKEITGYNSDLICLQEVDRKVFINDLLPAFESLGYSGVLQEKGGTTPEGEATFYRNAKFRQVQDCSIEIRKSVNEDDIQSDIKNIVSTNETLKQEMDTRGSVVQVLVLESVLNPGCRLCVANTHLYFHPKACCIRSLQTVAIIRHLQDVIQKQKAEGFKVSFVFCGDFNCSPTGGAYEFITKKHLGPDNYSWSTNPDLTLEGASFSHGLDLTNSCGILDYTNYARSFHEQLDYIFIDSTMDVLRVIPMPEHSEVEQHIALPSVVFPSDHIAQICDLKWKSLYE
ncbi:2',5'-phosphodiesterase 12-like [Mytilus edulis]|uniref:2',5'-phosphodiesterase 12-like n=1 Tax=Mytilus edulis TaxID=6550 RepID=UPI0039F06851